MIDGAPLGDRLCHTCLGERGRRALRRQRFDSLEVVLRTCLPSSLLGLLGGRYPPIWRRLSDDFALSGDRSGRTCVGARGR